MSPERIAVADDPSFDEHRAPRRHPECPERLAAARSGLAAALPAAQRLEIAARAATLDEVASVHDRGLVASIDRLLEEAAASRSFSMIDADTYIGPGTRDAAWRAAGASVEIARALAMGRARRAFAVLRPPGHHAEPSRAMGFCVMNNIAIAARAALAAGARRVAIVDWDVHHGNGTQEAFQDEPRVLFVSLHQWPLYPGTGAPGEIGSGAAAGTNANLALPPGSGPAEYASAFRRAVIPLVEGFAPDLLLVSAGYDAHRDDPLAAMRLDAPSYAAMTSALVGVAERLGHGRLGLFLEGGYDLRALEDSVAATVSAALGRSVELPHERAAAAAEAAITQTLDALRPYVPALGGRSPITPGS